MLWRIIFFVFWFFVPSLTDSVTRSKKTEPRRQSCSRNLVGRRTPERLNDDKTPPLSIRTVFRTRTTALQLEMFLLKGTNQRNLPPSRNSPTLPIRHKTTQMNTAPRIFCFFNIFLSFLLPNGRFNSTSRRRDKDGRSAYARRPMVQTKRRGPRAERAWKVYRENKSIFW